MAYYRMAWRIHETGTEGRGDRITREQAIEKLRRHQASGRPEDLWAEDWLGNEVTMEQLTSAAPPREWAAENVSAEQVDAVEDAAGTGRGAWDIVRQAVSDAEPITVERLVDAERIAVTDYSEIYRWSGVILERYAHGKWAVMDRKGVLSVRTMGDLRAAVRLLGGGE